jgi:glycosyltransferase involved in cell wall biosynthesis
MKIVLSIDRLDRCLGGAQIWLDGFARYLVKQNHEVHVLTFLDSCRNAPYIVHALSDPCHILSRASIINLKAAALAPDAFYDTGVAWSADVLQPHSGSAVYSERQYIKALGSMLRCRAALSPRAILRRRAMIKLENAQLRNAGKIIAVSHLVEHMLVSHYGIPETAISVIHNGVDTSRFDKLQLQKRRELERSNFAISETEVVFLVLANNFLLKGVDLVIRALGLLRRKGYSGIRVFVAGADPDRTMLNLIDREDVAGHIRFEGHVEDVTPLLAAADVFLHATRWDACSLVTIEAMASGLPVVTTAMNGAAELITADVNGIVLADAENVDSLAEAMLRFCDHDLRLKFGNNAYLSAQSYDINLNYQKMEALLLSR